ncbi:hypothetical protein EVAR_19513_1 [Eumeta japonica]|uniref:PDZ domain-containing protein n=1 Tax=Eumeta variegata TaxID=151549 RepID=A0A4C1VA61_EUMVA|nr:hypothetical protein EVAR_19513_1 [Eumeta japonica]
MLKFCSPAAKRKETNMVNPGRKASLGGIREGDVISSINGRPTRSMSNSEAHALLRSSGPVLKLGLNEALPIVFGIEHAQRRYILRKASGSSGLDSTGLSTIRDAETAQAPCSYCLWTVLVLSSVVNIFPLYSYYRKKDRDTSPRRRSIGKATELKRPSQLIAEVQSSRAVPQAPVYATIRPSQSPNNTSSPLRSSLNSLPGAVVASNHLKTVTTEPTEEQPKFHPTNPFYSTLPTNNYSSASRLPVPNGRSSLSSLDRSRSISKSRDSSIFNDSAYAESLKSPLANYYDSGPSSFVDSHINNRPDSNNYDYNKSNINSFIKNDPFLINTNKMNNDYSLPNDNYFKIYDDSTTLNKPRNYEFSGNAKDPFEKYLRMSEDKIDADDTKYAANSNSHGDIYNNCKEEIIRSTTITEHKIDETEEIKTIKKMIFNAADSDCPHPERLPDRPSQESQRKTGKPTG